METANKYGITINLPGSKGTKPEKRLEYILGSIGVTFQMQFFFDTPGLRAKKFDAAIFANPTDVVPALLIEYDGAEHYSERFYESMGNRPCRNKAHVVKTNLGDADKARIALNYGIPLLRITPLHEECMRDLILSYVWTFVDNKAEKTREISMVKMLDKYGWDFDYVPPSEPNKAEKTFLDERQQRNG